MKVVHYPLILRYYNFRCFLGLDYVLWIRPLLCISPLPFSAKVPTQVFLSRKCTLPLVLLWLWNLALKPLKLIAICHIKSLLVVFLYQSSLWQSSLKCSKYWLNRPLLPFFLVGFFSTAGAEFEQGRFLDLLPGVCFPGILLLRFTYKITKMIPIHDHLTITNLETYWYGGDTLSNRQPASGRSHGAAMRAIPYSSIYAPDMYGPIIDVERADNWCWPIIKDIR